MRPSKPAKSKAGLSRAKMFIRRDLSWTEGFPVENGKRWLALPSDDHSQHRVVDRALLRRTIRTVNMLQREFPHALPRAVGDVNTWAERHRTLVELLKPVVHTDGRLGEAPWHLHPGVSPSLHKRISKGLPAAPALRNVYSALLWSCWTRIDRLAGAVQWFTSHRGLIQALCEFAPERVQATTVRLHQLTSSHGIRRLRVLVEAFATEELWRYPFDCSSSYLDEVRRQLQSGDSANPQTPEQRPKAMLGTRLLDFVEWLPEQETKRQRRALELLHVFEPAKSASQWRAWWEEVENETAQARRTPSAAKKKPRRRRSKTNGGPAVQRSFETLAKTKPPALPPTVLMGLLMHGTAAENEKLFAAFRRNLKAWPALLDGANARLSLANHWLNLWCRGDAQRRSTLLRLVPKLTAHAKKHRFDLQRVAPWSDAIRSLQRGRHSTYGIDDDIVEELMSREQLDAFFEIIDAQTTIDASQAELLVQIISTFPIGRVEHAFAALRDSKHKEAYIDDEVLRLVADLTREVDFDLDALLGVFVDATDAVESFSVGLRAGMNVF
ncbi:MAG: hypothetical protein AAFQ82_16880, partial [Myxococcota bacterium]